MTAWLPFSVDWLPLAGTLPPAFVFLGSALLVALCRRESRRPLQRLLLVATPVVGTVNLLALNAESSWVWHFLGLELELLRVDRLSWIFGLLFHLGAFIGAIYAFRVRDGLQHVAVLAYAGSALGAVFAGDLLSLFFYWEGMALTSAFLVWARRTPSRTQLAFATCCCTSCPDCCYSAAPQSSTRRPAALHSATSARNPLGAG